MKVRSIKLFLVLMGIVTIACSALLITMMNAWMDVTRASLLATMIMIAGTLMIFAGILIRDKYTTYDELHKLEEKKE